MTTFDLTRYPCATVGCDQPPVFVRQTTHPTAFYGECCACHVRIEHAERERAKRARVTQDRRALAEALIGRQPSWALHNMVRALSVFATLNTDEETARLAAARAELRRRRATR